MKKLPCFPLILWALCLLLALGGCAPAVPPEDASVSSPEDTLQTEAQPESFVFSPTPGMSPQETVAAYFDQQYQSYVQLAYTDISAIVDMEESAMRNSLVWLQTLIQRRRLLLEHALCYVETERFDYTIRFLEEDELEDRPSPFRQGRTPEAEDDTALTLHFIITGEPGKAYPPMLAMNSQHTIRLRQVDGVWQVASHYYPGSVRKFRRSGVLTLPDEGEALAQLQAEFAGEPDLDRGVVPAGARAYNGEYAARYALLYTEAPNPAFYNIGDWMGNCANFTSQCIWYGFGDGENLPGIAAGELMAGDWFAGAGGGSPAWENVGHFWDYAIGNRELKSKVLDSLSSLTAGDLIQVRTGDLGRGSPWEEQEEEDEDEEEYTFNHSLIVVDAHTLMLAQNSPGCFVYYSDLVNIQSRMLRPVAMTP